MMDLIITTATVAAVGTAIGMVYAPNETKGFWKWNKELTAGAVNDTKAYRAKYKKPGMTKAELENKVKQGGKKKRLLKSDREIRYAKKQFSKILKSFGPMIKNKTASESTILEFRRYLRIYILEMEVDSLTAQGDVSAERDDVTTASSFYKAARKILIDFNMQYPEKNQRIKELAKKSASLFNGGQEEEGSLAKELSKETESDKDEHGFPSDPNQDTKQHF